jgi:MFS family permease
VLGSVGAVWAAFFYRWFRNHPAEKEACNEAERELIHSGPQLRHDAHRHPSPPWGRLFRMPTVYALCLASTTVCFPWYFYATWQPLFFSEVYDVPDSASEIITGLPFLFGAAGSLVGGSLSDWLIRRTGSRRWGRSLLGISGFTAAGLCYLAAPYAPQFWQATALLCLASFFNDLGIPTIWAACADIGGRFSGTLSGIMNMAGGIGAVASPIVVPHLNGAFAHYGAQQRWIMVLGILSSGWFVGAVAWACINTARPIEDHEPAAAAEANGAPAA